MNQTIDTGLYGKRAKGTTMEAHAGTIGIEVGRRVKPRRRRLASIATAIRERRAERAERAYRLRVNGGPVQSLPGSEHTHLVRRPRGF
jgi:hypothetical protein